MKYELTISGGFSGLSRSYKGELPLSEKNTLEIIELLQHHEDRPSEKGRDVEVYHIRIHHRGNALEWKIGEENLPEPLRDLLVQMRQQQP